MPSLDDASVVLDNYAPDLVELAWAEAAIPGQNDRLDPELGLIPLTANVNVLVPHSRSCGRTASTILEFQRCEAR